jgi:hypothetical protein
MRRRPRQINPKRALTPIRTGRPYVTAVRIGDLFCRPVLIMRRTSSSTEPITSIVKSPWRRVITSGHNGLTSLDSLRPIVQQRTRRPPIDHPGYEILHRSSDREIVQSVLKACRTRTWFRFRPHIPQCVVAHTDRHRSSGGSSPLQRRVRDLRVARLTRGGPSAQLRSGGGRGARARMS